MPTFKLHETTKGEIKGNVFTLTNRLVAYAQGGFPLTTEEMQHLICSERHVEMLTTLEREGVQDLPTTIAVFAAFLPEIHTGVKRAAAVFIETPRRMFTPREKYVHYNNPRDNDRLPPNLDLLVPEQRAALIKWVNRAVRAKRQEEMVKKTVSNVLGLIDDTATLVATWPNLTTFVTGKTMRDRIARTRASRKLPEPAFVGPTMLRCMAATDTLLAGAQMMTDPDKPTGVVRAQVQGWEPLPDDPKFT